ncbi:MAG: hypothetical protein IJU23_05425 [Proteobacteria bacterium]|nr:hypothetical protein [Pseudomonadota bacterium]
MLNIRKCAFMLSALMIAGVGLSGCDEQNWTCGVECNVVDPDTGNGGTMQSDFKSMASYTTSELKNQSECTGSSACLSSSKCKDDAAYVACLCVSSDAICHEFPNCNGVGKCQYKCGETSESCSYSACAKDPACQGETLVGNITCLAATNCDGDEAAQLCEDVAKMNPKEDFDGDGLTNEEELNHPKHPHPCFKDSDKDGADDKREVNAGSDPMNPASVPAGNDDLRNLICTHEALSTVDWTEVLKDMNIAKLNGAKYESTSSKLVSVFGHESNHVYGFFGSGQKTNGAQLLKAAGLTAGTYIEEAKFSSTIPLASWTNYNHDLQIVPDSEEVNRYKFTITLGAGETIQDLQNKIAKVFDSSAPKLSGSDNCSASSGKVSLYLARSSYTKDGNTERIYGGAMTCANNLTTNKTLFMLEDVLSGTLVSPNTSIANIGGDLFPYQTNHCQVGTVLSSGYVDFIWVVDNSGSMEDELDSVAATVEKFTQRLGGSGITYRVAVTYTDAYLVDERMEPEGLLSKVSGNNYYTFYDENGGYLTNSYLTGLGFRNYEISNRGAAAFLSTPNLVKTRVPPAVQKFKACGVTVNSDNPNICGFGYEDGLKSGLVGLQRLSLDPNGSKPSWVASDEEFELLKKIKQSIITKLKKDDDVKFDDANKALKYIIWVSDEESRQFKEECDYSTSDLSKAICKTGYKLQDDGTMRTGALKSDDGAADSVCNPSIADNLDPKVEKNFEEAQADASKVLFQDMSLEEIKQFDTAYYNMLRYYLMQYQQFAGEGGITGFALVGDSGNRNGGVCKTLKVCDGLCFADAQALADSNGTKGQGQVGCFECLPETEGGPSWRDDSAAKDGANYGLSYIHLARFLGTNISEEGGKIVTEGKEGGFASICNTSFDVSVDAIFEDVAGRVASKYSLEGYPISSTIRVGAMKNGKAFELERGATTNGWTYDASQNAVIFTSLQVDKDSDLAISYDLWKVKEG